MSSDLDKAEALRREIVGALVDQLGMREVMAMPIADTVVGYLQCEYGGERITIPKPQRRFDVLQIEALLRSGRSPYSVARLHGTTVNQLKRLFPQGLPLAETEIYSKKP